MPLSSPTSRRALKHTRAIQIEAFARDDGLWDIDAHITDIKTRDSVKQRVSTITQGCTHLIEPAQVSTAAIQAFADNVIDMCDDASTDEQSHNKPFQLDRCHALRIDGEAVAKHYPRWAVKSLAVSESS